MKQLYIYIVVFLLSACSSSYQVSEIESSEQKFTAEYQKQDALIEHEIEPYRENLESSMNKVIAYAVKDMSKKLPESSIRKSKTSQISNPKSPKRKAPNS